MYEYARRPSKFKKFILTFLLVAVTSASSVFIYAMYKKIDTKNINYETKQSATRLYNDAVAESNDMTGTLEDATKSVVGISKIKNKGTAVLDINGTDELGLGSGVVFSENGYIITNWHVAGDKYSTCYVTLESGSTYKGSVVWADSNLDLAIVKITAEGLKYLELGDSDSLSLGQDVWAIGNPIGVEFQRTITKGIISGLNRTLKIEDENLYMEDLIQTDASINSGNSGGPLINKEGKIIGINSVKITSAEGIGFAVPINIIKTVIESFAETGEFEEAYLGIFAYDREAIKYINSNLDFNSGIYVVQISSDGPAKKSGLKIGDIITKIDSFEINKMSELRSYIYGKKPGETVVLTVNRNGKEYSATITLGKK